MGAVRDLSQIHDSEAAGQREPDGGPGEVHAAGPWLAVADLALSGGLTPQTGAGSIPAVADLWQASVAHARFLWLSWRYRYRFAATPGLWRYLHRHFTLIYTDPGGGRLYRRTHKPITPGNTL